MHSNFCHNEQCWNICVNMCLHVYMDVMYACMCGGVYIALYISNPVALESSSIRILIPFFVLIHHEIPQQDLKEIKALKCQLITFLLT